MLNEERDPFYYERLRKLNETKNQNYDSQEKDDVVLENLTDVFKRFEKLIITQPYYSQNNNLNVKEYLEKTYKKKIENAINRNDQKEINNICNKIGRIYTPKHFGLIKRIKEQNALKQGLYTLIKQYRLCQDI